MKKIATVTALISASIISLTGIALAAEARDCDANAVMHCGAYSKSEFNQKLAGQSDLSKIYFQENRGITQSGDTSMDSASTIDGEVRKDGTVWAGGKMVATNAISTGRSNMPGSSRDGSLWARPPSVSFRSESIPAFVNMAGGSFKWAMIKSCGNPVKATPMQQPKPQVTQPTPPPPKPAPPPPQPTPIQPSPAPQPIPVSGPTEDLMGASGGALVGFLAAVYRRGRKQIARAFLH